MLITISKAIRILSDSSNAGMTTFNQEYKDAQRLGIEALKRIHTRRVESDGKLGPLLTGETED